MQLETLAIRLPTGTTLRDWLASYSLIEVEPSADERAAMERLADTLERKGPIGRRKDRDRAIELRYGALRITVVADGARVTEKISITGFLKEATGVDGGAGWWRAILNVEHGLVLYDAGDDVAVAPPGVDLGPEPYAPPRPRRFGRRR